VAGDRVEWLKRQVEVWNAGDIDGLLDALGPDFEFTPDPSFPDLSRTWAFFERDLAL
jgi:hypothetical protein